MGRQVRFYNYPSDVDAFEAFIRSIEPVAFLPERMPTRNLTELPTLRMDQTDTWRFRLLIVRRTDLARLAADRQDINGQWLVRETSGPVTVQYSPGHGRDGRPRRQCGRIWFATTYPAPTGDELVPADADYVRWASRLLGWVRRHWTRIDNDYYSPRAVADHPGLFPTGESKTQNTTSP
jgi:hypothetical protein